MPAYTVHEPTRIAEPLKRFDAIAFVKEGFSWPALLFSLLWLLYHRMWLVLIGSIAAMAMLGYGFHAAGADAGPAGWASVAAAVVFAFFANDLRRWSLGRRRYRMVGAVAGRSRHDCERRFFAGWLERAGEAGGGETAADNSADAMPAPSLATAGRRAQVAIVDYGSGNLHSAAKAFERAAREAGGGLAVKVTADPREVAQADRIVLPGVGAFADCMAGLKRIDGMTQALEECVRGKARPFLGICVGMQLMATRGLEHGESPGFDWIAGEVTAIQPADAGLKIPHMGWNTLDLVRPHPLLEGIALGPEGLHAYFVHSYHFAPRDRADVVAETDHGGRVTAMVARDNLAGVQFHPEKSQALGLALIANFLRWKP